MYLVVGHEPEINDRKVGALPGHSSSALYKYTGNLGDGIFTPLGELLIFPIPAPSRPSFPTLLPSSHPQLSPVTSGRQYLCRPQCQGLRRLPGACSSLLFSSPCNSRGQVRCASKHCNHILNGNEMCELNVNYSRMEGQSLLVKVWHLFLQTFPKRHNLFPPREMRGCNYEAAASAVGLMLVTGSFVCVCGGGGDLHVTLHMYFK